MKESEEEVEDLVQEVELFAHFKRADILASEVFLPPLPDPLPEVSGFGPLEAGR